MGFLGGSVVKNPPAHCGDLGSVSGSGRFPGGVNGNPPQYSCLRNPMDRGAWRATVHGVARVGYNLATKLSHRIINHQMHMACRKIIFKIGKNKQTKKKTQNKDSFAKGL